MTKQIGSVVSQNLSSQLLYKPLNISSLIVLLLAELLLLFGEKNRPIKCWELQYNITGAVEMSISCSDQTASSQMVPIITSYLFCQGPWL